MYLFYILGLFSFCYFFKNIKKYFFERILLWSGYKFELNTFNMPTKCIIIGSHTSIYDFFIGLFYYYAFFHEKYNTYILMKKQFEIVCTPILSYLDNRFKLISVDTYKNGLTEKICKNLQNKDNYILYIAPEGTRKCTETLKSGYWYIAKELDIEIIYFGIDFLSKKIILEKSRKVKDTWEEEQKEFINSCKKYVPLYPERCFWTKDFYKK